VPRRPARLARPAVSPTPPLPVQYPFRRSPYALLIPARGAAIRAASRRVSLCGDVARTPADASHRARRHAGLSAAASEQETPQTGRTAWARNMAAPVRDFLGTETGSAVVLLAAAVIALIWANSPLRHSYETLWTTRFSLRLGGGEIGTDLRHWVNQGLMTLFFLVVGLEAKRELDLGELRERRRVAIPALAALGGMVVPIAIYLAFNAGGAGAKGWGSAMSTDTALALGALALITPRTATRLRVFMLTLAVVDDLVALIVIATAYTTSVSIVPLGIAVALFGALVALRYAPFFRGEVSVAVGVGLWIALFKSGIDPVIAGLAIGLVTSAYPPSREDLERATELARSFREQPTPDLARSAQLGVQSAISPNERMQYSLHPWSSYVVVPLFALANTGVHVTGTVLSRAVSSPITLGVFFGYVLGKPLGIVSASWLASRPRLHGTRPTLSWPILGVGGTIAGIGFTVSLLISSLAFHGERLAEAKLGVLAAAVVAPMLAWMLIRAVQRLPAAVRARQIAGTAADLLDLAVDVDPEHDHIRGPHGALVTVVEYGDFECPYCGQAESTMRELLGSDADLRYVWRHLPLNDVHSHAQLAAEASEAAADQNRFWEFYDSLFGDQSALGTRDMVARAQELGLDVARFEADLRRHDHAARIAEDVASADESGVSGTPTFFINGRRYYGAYDVETLAAAVRAARVRSKALATAAS
jgi:Na+/H+ antiporter NhaA